MSRIELRLQAHKRHSIPLITHKITWDSKALNIDATYNGKF